MSKFKKNYRYITMTNKVYMFKNNCDALRDLVPFAHFKKSEKHP